MEQSSYYYKTKGTLQRIKLEEVIALETARNYVKFHTKEGAHLVRSSMDLALKQLKGKGFVRINRYFAVPIDKIENISKESVQLYAEYGTELQISKNYYPDLIRHVILLGEDTEGNNDEPGDQEDQAAK